MAVKVEYYQTAKSGLLITAVWDGSTQMWSCQWTPEAQMPNSAFDLSNIERFKDLGFRPAAERLPRYQVSAKSVQVGTSGQRILFRKEGYHLEYWLCDPRNGQWAGSVILWGKQLPWLFAIMRKHFGEAIVRVFETPVRLKVYSQPITYIRRAIRLGKGEIPFLKRIESICQEGLLAWNVRLALYRMRGLGQPVGDQMTVDCLSGGWRYIFFNYGAGAIFAGEPVGIVPRQEVLQRSSNRWHLHDSGATQTQIAQTGSLAKVVLAAQTTPLTSQHQEFLVLGQIQPRDMVVLTRDQQVMEICAKYGVEYRDLPPGL